MRTHLDALSIHVSPACSICCRPLEYPRPQGAQLIFPSTHSLQSLTDALHGVAAGSAVREEQDRTLEAGSHVMQQSEGLLREVKSAVDVPNQPNKKLRLAQVRPCSLHVTHNHANKLDQPLLQPRLSATTTTSYC